MNATTSTTTPSAHEAEVQASHRRELQDYAARLGGLATVLDYDTVARMNNIMRHLLALATTRRP